LIRRASVISRTIVVWVLLAVIGVSNGILRGAVLVPRLGDQRAHVVSTLVLCALIIVVALFLIEWIGPRTVLEASIVGLMWAVLTVAFEFSAGHFVFGNSWEKLLADYSLWHGRIWVLVPIALYLAPRLAFRLRVM